MKHSEMPSVDIVRQLLSYDPATGVFTWRERRGGSAIAGSIAGGLDTKRYLAISVNGKRYRAHRLAWLYMTGEWPAEQIDHRDGDRANNQWTNLRAATNSQNAHNCGKRAHNSSGVKGVHWHTQSGCWRAEIRHGGAKRHLGSFSDINAAQAAYALAAADLHGDFARAA